MSTTANNVWKEALLSTGMPLEHSVRGTLAALGFEEPKEFQYWRRSDTGQDKQFSIDVCASQLIAEKLNLHLLIECKYRNESKQWVFPPDEIRETQLASREVLPLLQIPLSKKMTTSPPLANLLARYPQCGKGVELLKKEKKGEANPAAILQALQQLRFSVAPKVRDCISWQKETQQNTKLFCTPDLILPLLITTAELWRIRKTVGIDEIRSAEHLSEVADNTHALWLHQLPDNELGMHSYDVLKNTGLPPLPPMVTLTGEAAHTRNWASVFSANQPWLVLVIHYSKLNSVMKELISELSGLTFAFDEPRTSNFGK